MEFSPKPVTKGGFRTYLPRERMMLRKMGKLEKGSPVREPGENIEISERIMEVRGKVEKDLEGLEAAFMRRWNHENNGDIIELGEEAWEDEERWQRSLIGKLQTKRWFGEEEIKKELIMNWNTSNKFEFMMAAKEFQNVEEGKLKEGERLKKELTRSDLEGKLSLTKSGIEGIMVLSETKVTTDKTCLYQLPDFKVVRQEVQLGCTEGTHKGEGTEDKEDVAMLTPEKGRSVLLDKQGSGEEELDGLTAMDFSPNPGKMIIGREIRSVDMTDATEDTRSKASTSRSIGYTFSACKKLIFQTLLDERLLKAQALYSDSEHPNPENKPKSPFKPATTQPYKTTTCNPTTPKKPKLKNQEIPFPTNKNPIKSSSPKVLKRKLESDQNLVSASYSSPAQALVTERRLHESTNEGGKDGKKEEITEALENRKPKSKKGRPKNGNRHKHQGGQTDGRGTDREFQSNKEEFSHTGDKRRKIIHSSIVLSNPSDLLFSGNFKRVWLKFLKDPKMRKSYVGTSSRNERKERVIRGDADAGAVNMKAEDKSNFNQVVFDDLIEKTRAVRGMSVFAPESIQVGKEISTLKDKGFSFAKALTINGEHTTEEADEDYALFLIAYAEDTEKIADDKFEEDEGYNLPKGDSKVAGNDQPPST
ncbi:hypothetical protein FRX31_021744 [Thalictrum thalictroides]|uniref:Uncharacterized protein n=1 Tax=Thalictrum thalictroides TaxID=46969 RepID=A0A7J6VWX2_THATH|nr:hypothetical protein FRX31_021744 [Thalictrum thalictroides]